MSDTTSSTAVAEPLNWVEKICTGVLLVLAASANMAVAPAYSAEVAQPQPKPSPEMAASARLSQPQMLPNGTYLYGQAPRANQIGSAYMVIQVSDRTVVGAFYMPSSSFDCFHGTVQTNQLALNIVDGYEQTKYPFSVELRSKAVIATATPSAARSVEVVGYQQLPALSQQDHRMLETCQAHQQAQALNQ